MSNIAYFRRQEGLLPRGVRNATRICVIGTGGIGSATATILAKMGLMRRAQLWDPDKVEPHNVGTQAFRTRDVGLPKVEALREIVEDLIGETELEARSERWSGMPDPAMIYISGVDSLESRREIWGMMKRLPPILYVDGRMGALDSTVYAVTPARAEAYEKTLNSSVPVVQEPCTARATYFTGAGIGAVISSLVYRFVRREQIPFCTQANWGSVEVVAV